LPPGLNACLGNVLLGDDRFENDPVIRAKADETVSNAKANFGSSRPEIFVLYVHQELAANILRIEPVATFSPSTGSGFLAGTSPDKRVLVSGRVEVKSVDSAEVNFRLQEPIVPNDFSIPDQSYGPVLIKRGQFLRLGYAEGGGTLTNPGLASRSFHRIASVVIYWP
jgi:hypothetical protein